MLCLSIWIRGRTRSGRTTYLVNEFRHWVEEKFRLARTFSRTSYSPRHLASLILVFAANDDNRRDLVNKLSISVPGSYPVVCKTPLGFFFDEVILFWPLLFEQLKLKAQFPLRLRPETEQELATRLWRPYLDENFTQTGISEYRLVRRILDLLQLAGASGIPVEDIPTIVEQGLPEQDNWLVKPKLNELLLAWREWCLERGLLSYGLIYELYWRYLLPNDNYQQQLLRRYQAIFADDVDDYPAITKDLFNFLVDHNLFGVFTYNPEGQVRLGLNADPNYLSGLASRCQVIDLSARNGLAAQIGETVLELAINSSMTSLPHSLQSIQTTSRAQLLRKTSQFIIEAIARGEVKPEDIAIIAPGLDEIARYTLIEIISAEQIPIEPLNEQRPLISCPLVRALLTLMGLVYPGLGRLVRRDEVAEMLIILSRKPKNTEPGKDRKLIPDIDPVRAGLIADYCYHIDPEQPRLLPVETFCRWDRLGHRVTYAYKEILDWLEATKLVQKEQGFTNPIIVLEQAIRRFIGNGSYLPFEQLASLRELIETAQHFWEVERRLRLHQPSLEPQTTTVAQFIQLLRRGTITANPRPVPYLGKKEGAITLANIFQYRSLRCTHRWQFWLDASSHLWDKGGASSLFGAPLFLREWSGWMRTPEEDFEADQARLVRILWDLLGRVGERVYLCHSDLGVNGSEQIGPLSILVHAAREVATSEKILAEF